MADQITIAPFQTGLDTDIEPWLAPPDSFTNLNNMHVEHGYLEKRNGYQLFATDPSQLANGTAVTGFGTYIETDTGVRTMMAFDTLSAYRYNGTTKAFVQLANATGGSTSIFTGDQDDFVWSANWLSTASSTSTNRIYFTNGVAKTGSGATSKDGIWYYTGTATTTVTSFEPTLRTGVTLKGAKLIFSIGQRLVCLFTYEGTTPTLYPQRARWCAKQDPSNWNDVTAGGGGFVDAATGDQIISARILQNQLIVQFTDSIWTLTPTSDPARPFRWLKLNDFRSCQSKMGTIGFDKFVAAIGDRGITACDGNNTYRLDDRISTFTVDNISATNSAQTFCLRDFNNRRWWSLYNESPDSTSKTKCLIWDEESGAFSTYSITLNVLGYGIQGEDWLYSDFTAANGQAAPDGTDIQYQNFNDDQTYGSYFWQKDGQLFIGGGYDGTVYVLESSSYDVDTNFAAEFTSAAWNPYQKDGIEAVMPYIDLYVGTDPNAQATVYLYKDTDETAYKTQVMDFLPDLNFLGTIINASQANPCQVTSPNHGLSTGDVIYIYHVQGMTNINSGEGGVAYTITKVDDNNFTLDDQDSTAYSAYTTGGEFYERPFYRTKTWKRIFAGGTGFQHRIGFESFGLATAFRIHGFKPAFKPRGKRISN